MWRGGLQSPPSGSRVGFPRVVKGQVLKPEGCVGILAGPLTSSATLCVQVKLFVLSNQQFPHLVAKKGKKKNGKGVPTVAQQVKDPTLPL